MKSTDFKPGFRISRLDLAVIVITTLGALISFPLMCWAGFVIAFVVAHFFLFCNVFRISRIPELIWAATFVLLAGATIIFEIPGWIVSVVSTLILTVTLIVREIRLPSYHGICWRQWNPNLPQWWETHCKMQRDPLTSAPT